MVGILRSGTATIVPVAVLRTRTLVDPRRRIIEVVPMKEALMMSSVLGNWVVVKVVRSNKVMGWTVLVSMSATALSLLKVLNRAA